MSVAFRLPVLAARKGVSVATITNEYPSSEWAIDTKAPVVGACGMCAGRGKFVSRTNKNIKLECEQCGGTGK